MVTVSANHIPPQRPAGSAKAGAFGDLLRRAREARGLALEAVADATRIARRHLDALERSDLDALPPGPFGKGYVRAYAKLLGIDPDPILEAYRARESERGLGTAEDERRMLEELSHLVRKTEEKKRPPLLDVRRGSLLLAVVLVILGALGWSLTRARAPKASVATLPPPSGRASPAVGAPPVREPAESRTPKKAVEAKPPPTDALQVSDHGVGTGLDHRRLVGRADRFPAGTRVSFWTEVLGGQPGHVIRHVWFQEGRAVMKADLPVGASHWRTHSSLLLPEGSAGRWAVEARTSDGRLLVRDEFLCESDGG
jgi:transcriptional regulator with XRE-family HTH domain